MFRLRTFLLAAALLAVVSCHPAKPKTYDPSYVRFEAAYNPYLENQFYPSLVMGVSALSDKNFGLDDTNALFSVSVTAPAGNSVLRITIDSSNLNYVTIFQEVLPVKDVRYTFHPSIKWKYDKLYQLRQQGTTDLTFTCYINDEEVDVKNIRLNYRSVNDCLLSVLDADNLRPVDVRPRHSAVGQQQERRAVNAPAGFRIIASRKRGLAPGKKVVARKRSPRLRHIASRLPGKLRPKSPSKAKYDRK